MDREVNGEIVEDPNIQQFRGCWMRAELFELMASREITVKEAMLLMTVDSLVRAGKGCFAGNKHLGERIQTKERTVQVYISHLIKLGLLIWVSFDGRKRYLETAWSSLKLKPKTPKPVQETRKKLNVRREIKRMSNMQESACIYKIDEEERRGEEKTPISPVSSSEEDAKDQSSSSPVTLEKANEIWKEERNVSIYHDDPVVSPKETSALKIILANVSGEYELHRLFSNFLNPVFLDDKGKEYSWHRKKGHTLASLADCIPPYNRESEVKEGFFVGR